MSNTTATQKTPGSGFTITYNSHEFSKVQIATVLLAGGIVALTTVHYAPIYLKPIFSYAVKSGFESPSFFQQVFKASYDITATSFKILALAGGLPVGLKLIKWMATFLSVLAEKIINFTQQTSDWMFNHKTEVYMEMGTKALAFYLLALPLAITARIYGVI